MNALWEIILPAETDESPYAAHEAFAEVDHIEQELSRFVATSDVSRVNEARIGCAIPVGPTLLEILALAKRVCEATGGAFDPTTGPGARGNLAAIEIDHADHTVTRHAPVRLDLGAIGKGYAVDGAIEILRDWGIAHALVHSAQSTVRVLGRHLVQLRHPRDENQSPGSLELTDESLSGSAAALKHGHILDPSTGSPAHRHLASWALCQSAALSDAFSTAFMAMSTPDIGRLCSAEGDVRAHVYTGHPAHLLSFGSNPLEVTHARRLPALR